MTLKMPFNQSPKKRSYHIHNPEEFFRGKIFEKFFVSALSCKRNSILKMNPIIIMNDRSPPVEI